MRTNTTSILFLCGLLLLLGCGSAGTDAGSAPNDADVTERDGGATDAGDIDAGDTDGGDGDASRPPPTPTPCSTTRVRENLAIPTSDGHTLNGWIDRPDDPECQLPTILMQTPYDAETSYTLFFSTEERASRPLFASDHYNYVGVDWRGRFGSSSVPDGDQGPLLAQDTYDIVEYIAAADWSDGQVGTWGVSALCGVQYVTSIGPRPTMMHPGLDDGPPASLVAMVPIMCPLRESYDAVYPGGVIRHERVHALDVLGFGLRRLYESNPRENFLWDIAARVRPSERIAVPALVVGGFYDIQPRTTVDAFRELVTNSDPSVRTDHRLLIGPWIHFAAGGETSAGAGRSLSAEEQRFQDLERRIDRDSLAFFDHHMRGLDNDVPRWELVRYLHENVGWQAADDWPPSGAPALTFYLHEDGTLSETAPSAGTRSFDHDPSDPSPTLGGATLSPFNCLTSATPLACALGTTSAEALVHGPTSQAALASRTDQITFQTAPLGAPLTLLGSVRVFVDVATTGADGDVAVRLLDIDASGDPLLIGEGIHRISARTSMRTPSPVVTGMRYSLEIELLADIARDLPAGHRLGVMISATNWPLFGRNPNDGAVFYRGDTASRTPATLVGDGRAATHTLHLDGVTRIEVNGGT